MQGIAGRTLVDDRLSPGMLLDRVFQFIQEFLLHLKCKVLKKGDIKHIGYIHRILF